MNKLFFKDEHLMIQKMVREFAESEVKPVATDLDKKQQFPSKIVEQMGELGLMGILVPEK